MAIQASKLIERPNDAEVAVRIVLMNNRALGIVCGPRDVTADREWAQSQRAVTALRGAT
jgi:hypothetical protein